MSFEKDHGRAARATSCKSSANAGPVRKRLAIPSLQSMIHPSFLGGCVDIIVIPCRSCRSVCRTLAGGIPIGLLGKRGAEAHSAIAVDRDRLRAGTSPAKQALRKIPPEQYPDFSKSLGSANVNELRESAKNSLIWLGKASSTKKYPYLDIDHDRAVASIHAFVALINSNAFGHEPEEFNRRIAAGI